MFDLVLLPRIGTMLALAGGTLVTEDLTSIGAGVLVASGQIDFVSATAACFAGILAGDLLLFFLGRHLGRRLLAFPLVGRFVSASAVERSAAWLEQRGPAVVLATRLIPGTRLPTYIAAGTLGVNPWKFAACFTLAAAIWTPLLVGISAVVGAQAAQAALLAGSSAVVAGSIVAAILWSLVGLARFAWSWRGRRFVYGTWRRWTRWEFWPPWLFYPPVVAYIAFLMCTHRSLTVFTAANPAIAGGGFVGESKFRILRALAASGKVARAAFVPGELPARYRQSIARLFMRGAPLTFPVVLKPDQGQRGSGVLIVRDEATLEKHIAASPVDLILQEYMPGLEFGVFYYRRPGETRGRILSITDKRFPVVVGDGRHSLGELVLKDSRAVCNAGLHKRTHRTRWEEVPAPGEPVQLVEIGSHCRGAIFLDAGHLATPELEAAVDAAARSFDGFYFGRFDVRAPSIEDLQQGDFRILELNGVTSEATHIYDPSSSVWAAYRVLFAQWRLAFEIGEENRLRGTTPEPLSSLLEKMREYRRSARLHPGRPATHRSGRNLGWRETSNPA